MSVYFRSMGVMDRGEVMESGDLYKDQFFDDHRNPNHTLEVAKLIWLVDCRPVYLYEECVDMQGDLFELEAEAVEFITEVQVMAKSRPKCEKCGRRLAGNRTRECHACSRLARESQDGMGRQAALLTTRHSIEKERLTKGHRDEVQDIGRRMKKMEKDYDEKLSVLHSRVSSAEHEADVLKILCNLVLESSDDGFSGLFDERLNMARRLEREGYKKDG